MEDIVARSKNFNGIVLLPLFCPVLFNVNDTMIECGGNGILVIHVIDGGGGVSGRRVGGNGLVDEPDFYGIGFFLVFMVCKAKDDLGVLADGEDMWVVVKGSFWTKKIKLGELFSLFRGDDDVDERGDSNEYGHDENDGECLIQFGSLCGKTEVYIIDDALREGSACPADVGKGPHDEDEC